jgi:hypothetical protein
MVSVPLTDTINVLPTDTTNVFCSSESKRNEVAIINIVQAQVEEIYFIFNFECRYITLSRGILYRLPIKSHAQ